MQLNKTCLIVGAGASFDCFGDGRPGVPLTRDLLTGRAPFNLQEEFLQSIRSRVGRLTSMEDFPFKDDPEEAIGRGIERTIAFLLSKSRNSNPSIRAECLDLLRDVTRGVRNAITNSQLMQCMDGDNFGTKVYKPPTNYGWIVAACSVGRQISVITLNYDCILDATFRYARRCWRDPQQYMGWIDFLKKFCKPEGSKATFSSNATPYSPPDHGMYVKLHGSLFIYSCVNEDCSECGAPVLHGEFQSDLPDGIELGFSNDPQHTCVECQKPLYDLIIPPGENKSAGGGEFQRALHNSAVESVKRCESIVIIGYSFPEYDRDVINVIVQGCLQSKEKGKKEVYIVAPDATDIGRRVISSINKTNASVMSMLGAINVKDITFTDFVKVARLAIE